MHIKTNHACQHRGSILILVLIVTASLTVVAFSLAYRCQIELKLANSSCQHIQLHYLACGGLQRCLAVLSQQKPEPKVTLKVANFFSSSMQEALLGTENTELTEQSRLVYWIKDENGFLSLNYSDPTCWEKTGLLDRSQIASILDWIDTDSDANPDGAENDYYQRTVPPAKCKNGPIISLKELLNIKGITPENYSLPLATLCSNPISQNDISTLQEQINLLIRQNLVSCFSAYGNGKININTTPPAILSILPGLNESTANTVINYRAGNDHLMGTEDDACIEKTSDLTKIEGLSELEIELLSQYCCFDSDTFRIFSCAQNKASTYLLMATVKIIKDRPSILSIERLL